MAVYPIASSLINRPAIRRVLPKLNVVKQYHTTAKQTQNLGSKLMNSPKFQKLLERFVETIKIMKGIK